MEILFLEDLQFVCTRMFLCRYSAASVKVLSQFGQYS